MMKNISVLLITIALVSFVGASTLFASGPPGIQYTAHNLSNPNSNYKGADEDEICIYCHTPHGGSLTGPLWNRPTAVDANPASGGIYGAVDLKAAGYFTHYNSATLTAAARGNNRAVNDESLLCMTCHDGTIAVNRVLNVSNRTAPDPTYPTTRIRNDFDTWAPVVSVSGFPAVPGPAIGDSLAKIALGDNPGGDLSDDHPISFNYTAAQGADIGLHTLGDAQTAGVRFFGGNRVECSTCHDPHVDYGDLTMGSPNAGDANYTKYAPFLIMSNEASALCLACHIK